MPAKFIKHKTELAKAIGTGRVTLDKYLAMAGAPKSTPQGWSLEAVNNFILENTVREDVGSGGDEDIKTLRAREIRLRCERLRMQIDTEKGKLISEESVKSWLIGAIEKQKYILSLKLKNELPPKLEGLRAAEIAAKMEPLIADICQCLQTLKL